MTQTDTGAAAPAPFRILTVCTGNICRSPMAERLLHAGLNQRYPGQFTVESAGTQALVGKPVDRQVAKYISDLGGDPESFFARQLTPDLLEDQHLVLTLTREHRSRVVELSPKMLRNTFTLREFARLLPMVHLNESLRGAHRWRAAVPKVLRARVAPPCAAEDDDVIDPYGRDNETYDLMLHQLSPAILQIIDYS